MKKRSLHPKGLNTFIHHDNKTTEIFMTRGLSAIIDTSDFDSVHPYRWTPKPIRKGWYAMSGRGPGNKHVYMHCLIAGELEGGLEVDHRSGDGLDNRRENFRYLTHSQNCFNVGGRPERGVTQMKDGRRKPWCAAITRDGNTTSRYFSTKEEALAERERMELSVYPETTRESRRTWAA